MFIYARSEKRDLVPIYTITNTERIGIYTGKVKFILVKISSAPGQRKPNSNSSFLLLRIYPDSPVHTSANTECSNLFSYTVI